jgi:thiol-disulfide isomerase/thioredoxin
VLPVILFLVYAALVNDVRALIARNDLAGAEALTRSPQARSGSASELAAAVSWLARASLAAKQYDKAERQATEAFTLSEPLLRSRRLDADPWLPTAVGASIEVRSQVMAARGERADAVAFLRGELAKYRETSIAERISKNINLISLEGKPAPALDVREFYGPKPRPLSALRGHPVLLFFWAHWCGDCKQIGSVIANLRKTYGPQGLEVVMPTRLYGYVAGGEDAAPAAEKPYIDKVRKQFYSPLAEVPAPLSSANFLTYGASSTPTLVLIDAAGIVRYYHPGTASEAELDGAIRKLLGK